MNNLSLKNTTYTRGTRISRNKQRGSRWYGSLQLSHRTLKDKNEATTFEKTLADGSKITLPMSMKSTDNDKKGSGATDVFKLPSDKVKMNFVETQFKIAKDKKRAFEQLVSQFSAGNVALYLLAPANSETDASFIFGIVGAEDEVFMHFKTGISDGGFSKIKRTDVFRGMTPLASEEIDDILKKPNVPSFEKWMKKGQENWQIYKADLLRLKDYDAKTQEEPEPETQTA